MAAARNLVVKVMGWGNKEGGEARGFLVSGIGNRGCGILRSQDPPDPSTGHMTDERSSKKRL